MGATTSGARLRWLGLFALISLVSLLAAVVHVRRVMSDPAVPFLWTEGNAVWLRPDRPFNGDAQPGPVDIRTDYRTTFHCTSEVVDAVLHFRALRTAEVRLDGQILANEMPRTNWDRWQDTHSITLPRLGPGEHHLVASVLNHNGPALLQAWSDDLSLATGPGWEAKLPYTDWVAAISVHDPWIPGSARQAPPLVEALRSQTWPLATVFTVWLIVVARFSRRESSLEALGAPSIAASRVRWIVFALWSILALNNELKLVFHGFDAPGHSEYILYILEHWRIPFANEGWQMFQSPLYHILGAAVYGPISTLFRVSYGWHAVRLMTMACGILQVEVCYRAVRRVFPGRADLQIVGTLVGGLMPMNVYMSQALGNEPLAGLLSSMAFVIGLGIMSGENADNPRWWLLLGVTWGLAMLAKVTPFLLCVPLFVMCLRGAYLCRAPLQRVGVAAFTVLGGAFLVCGWYYVRNWVVLGRPFVGGWDPARRIEWWQDPGYRVTEHFQFGESLRYPIWAGYAGLWDGLYSTMWLDGYLHATLWSSRPFWNGMPLICTALLALIPIAAIAAGALRTAFCSDATLRWALAVSVLSIGIYLAAIASLYLRLPVYSAAKASYMLGLLPCFAILAAAGIDLLRGYRWVWITFFAAMLTWATYVYAAYFILAGDPSA